MRKARFYSIWAVLLQYIEAILNGMYHSTHVFMGIYVDTYRVDISGGICARK